MKTATIIDVRVEPTNYGRVRAVSRSGQKIHIVCDNFNDLRQGIFEALSATFEANGIKAQVYAPDVAPDAPVQPWVAVPSQQD